MAERAPRPIRFHRAQIEPLPDERCQALVQIEREGSGLSTATAQGGCGEPDVLRTVARATADAVSEAFESEGVVVRVRGVQLVEAFAQSIVVVSLVAGRGGNTQTLLGVCDVAGDLARGVARAVLNGTNRFLGVG